MEKTLARITEGPAPCSMVQPELQLRENMKVAVAHDGTSEDADVVMLKEGVIDHPTLSLVEDQREADWVLLVLRGFRGGHAVDRFTNNEIPLSKVAVVDFEDGPGPDLVLLEKVFAYFTRSFVEKEDGVLVGVPATCMKEKCFPFAYGVLNQYIENMTAQSIENARPRSLMCSLRPWLARYQDDRLNIVRMVGIARNRVLSWLHSDPERPEDAMISYDDERITDGGFDSGIVASLYRGTRTRIEPEYGEKLRSTDIVVTANPGLWEGDHRLWEHFASGNAVLSDEMYIPLPFAPKAGEHFIQYEVMDKPAYKELFLKKVHALLNNRTLSRELACHGFQHALRHHRSVSRVDYIMRTLAEMKTGAQYHETGMQLRQRDPVATAEQKEYQKGAQERDAWYIHSVESREKARTAKTKFESFQNGAR